MQENVPFTAQYDAVGRVTSFSANGAAAEFKCSHNYTWDNNGNRLGGSTVLNGVSQTVTHTLASGSNRLATAFGTPVTSNASGELTSLLGQTLAYDSAGRLSQATVGAQTTTSRFNGMNQRTLRDTPTEQSVYSYGTDGFNLLSETTRALATSKLTTTEHIYLPTATGPMPVAVVINGSHFAVHSDHLNTPRRVTDGAKLVRWQWPYSGFGEVAAQATPALNKAPISYNLRYPGQVDDGSMPNCMELDLQHQCVVSG